MGRNSMTNLRKMAGAAAAIAALLLVTPSSEAQVNKKQSGQATKLNAVTKTNLPQAIKKPHRYPAGEHQRTGDDEPCAQ
jgi:hypothetical protein